MPERMRLARSRIGWGLVMADALNDIPIDLEQVCCRERRKRT